MGCVWPADLCLLIPVWEGQGRKCEQQRRAGNNGEVSVKKKSLYGPHLWPDRNGRDLLLGARKQACVSCPIRGPPSIPPYPNHAKNKHRGLEARPTHQVLVRRVIRWFPFDDHGGFARMNHMQVTGRKAAVWNHLHYNVVRQWPLVGYHHPDLKPKHTHRKKIYHGLMQSLLTYFFNKIMTTINIQLVKNNIKYKVISHLPQIIFQEVPLVRVFVLPSRNALCIYKHGYVYTCILTHISMCICSLSSANIFYTTETVAHIFCSWLLSHNKIA